MNAIVTGSTKGIGRALVLGLLKEGWNVAVTSRHEADLQQFAQEVKGKFPDQECLVHAVDFQTKENTIRYARTMLATWPQIDLLVNNVGIFFPGSVHTEADGVLEETMDLNLFSPYHFTRAILPAMMKRRQGHIINMCSIASLISYPNGGAYTISKFALLGFSKALREEMKPYGIKVTSVMPGATWSGSWEGADYPADRLMPPEDVAEVILSSTRLGPSSVVEEILIRPQLGDL
ncbi:MAG TPA: SDR family oxidoreductase [Saprospiraceae bacterium]|nr:SDR family oxidoreductase [Saprospiraceae bacterium]